MNFKPVIGLEVHVELKTKSKMFCGCSADYFGQKPNTHTCPVCLGLPGALPVPNKKAIDWCITIGLALNCNIPLFSKFDRKNYFYPDLPKGYQISQYDEPFCQNGNIKLSGGKQIRIRRVHMEEDTAKLIHQGKNSLIDFNRSGVPLVEIVTEPDFETAKEVVEYLKKLQQIVRYLNVSDADMEKGNMRLEPNISLLELKTRAAGIASGDARQNSKLKTELPKYKVEVKNINSFRFVEKAIKYEIKRQEEILNEGRVPVQETRGWDEDKQRTVPQRVKEEANDYRYFPEPDIPPIRWAESQISNFKSQIPELPDVKLERFKNEYGLSTYDAEILTREKEMSEFFEEAVKVGISHLVNPKQIANVIINKDIDVNNTLPAELIKNILLLKKTDVIDEDKLRTIIKKVFLENTKAVNNYKAGKENVIMFLVGQVMRTSGLKLDANLIKEKLKKMLQ